MGYFSNGIDADHYEAHVCSACQHHGNCAVWAAHLSFNYQECNKPDSILHVLIPRDEKGYNEICRMFVAKPEVLNA